MTALADIFDAMRHARLAIAVSGGIDSLTLATAARAALGDGVTMHHAVSPAVPAEATERTRRQAALQGWSLDVFDAGEFASADYLANPVNRCFFCKHSLYGAIASRIEPTPGHHGGAQIASGTNTDDLGEYRPGLDAARGFGVRHPFVEAGMDKAAVRALAAELGLGDLSRLPSAPCLSSRIETGLAIEPATLGLVHRCETLVGNALRPDTVRCRVRAAGVVIELDEAALGRLDPDEATRLRRSIAAMGVSRPISFAAYRNGSAFLHDAVSDNARP